MPKIGIAEKFAAKLERTFKEIEIGLVMRKNLSLFEFFPNEITLKCLH